MGLSPLDIQHMEFQRGAGGYHRRQVREFLERVALEFEELMRQVQEQKAELARRAEKIAAMQTAEAELQRAIIAAERIGNEINLNARREAELIVQAAENLKTERLQAAEARLRETRGEIARLEREHALFRDQFRGMLDAYTRSLENQPRLGEAPAGRATPPGPTANAPTANGAAPAVPTSSGVTPAGARSNGAAPAAGEVAAAASPPQGPSEESAPS